MWMSLLRKKRSGTKTGPGGPIGPGGPVLVAIICLWTTYGCQNWSGRTGFGQDHFSHDIPTPTSAKLADPWMSAFGNTAEHWRTETLRPLLCGACVHVRPPGRLVKGHGDWRALPHPNSLHARVLAHPTLTGLTQQRLYAGIWCTVCALVMVQWHGWN